MKQPAPETLFPPCTDPRWETWSRPVFDKVGKSVPVPISFVVTNNLELNCFAWLDINGFIETTPAGWVQTAREPPKIEESVGKFRTRCWVRRRLEWNGKVQTLSAWAREVGLSEHCVRMRLEKGWTVERALTTPATVHTTYMIDGESLTAQAWARRYGVSASSVRRRLRNGATIEQALDMTIQVPSKRKPKKPITSRINPPGAKFRPWSPLGPNK